MSARPTVSRRAVLRGSIAATVAAIPAGAANLPTCDDAEALAGNARLLDLVADLDRLTAERGAIDAARRRVAAAWADRWPLAPDAASVEARRGAALVERDLLGAPILRAGAARPRELLDVACLRADVEIIAEELARARSTRRRGELAAECDALRAQLSAAEAHQAQREHIRHASGMAALDARAAAVRLSIKHLVAEILAQPAATFGDFLAKARAVDALEIGFIEAGQLCAELAGCESRRERTQEGKPA